jgi:hypothetical protein
LRCRPGSMPSIKSFNCVQFISPACTRLQSLMNLPNVELP